MSEVFEMLCMQNSKSENEEVLHVSDESHMDMGSEEHYNDLVLADGTRAIFLNETLTTADGQALVLQDGEDLSQYLIDEGTGQIFITREQEQSFLEALATQGDENVLQYVENNSSDIQSQEENDEQVLYIQGEELSGQKPEESFEYQLAELESENDGIPMKMVKLESHEALQGVDGVIDLEEFLSQQGLVQLEGGNFQYAVLKDGKLYLQTLNSEKPELTTTLDPELICVKPNILENNVSENNSVDLTQDGEVDLSKITGRNLLTGQSITLARYMDKIQNNMSKARESKKKIQDSKQNVHASKDIILNKLINKKLALGKTNEGKRLIAKIVNIIKKPGNNRNGVIREIKKLRNNLPPSKSHDVSAARTRVVNLVDEEDDTTSVQEMILRENTSKDSEKPIENIDRFTDSAHPSSEEESTIVTSSTQEPLQSTESKIDLIKPHQIPAKNPDNSKIIIHKKLISKECFDVITRTMSGLMNMESVVKKLKNKTVILKVLEKRYVDEIEDFVKNVSYCSGYMVCEYELNEEADNFSQSWKFILDSNSRDVILGDVGVEGEGEDRHPPSVPRQTANLTIQITVNSNGHRTTRVIVNPANMYKCKLCLTNFRSIDSLRVHMGSSHQQTNNFPCSSCSVSCKNEIVYKKHLKVHDQVEKRGMYECMGCSRRFTTSIKLRKHAYMHCKPVKCRYCFQEFPSILCLRKHLPVHEEPNITNETDPSYPHVKNKKYCCPNCGREFSRYSNLQRHIEIHNAEGARYKCSVCSCSYHYVSSLTRHVVQSHVAAVEDTPPLSPIEPLETIENQVAGIMPKQEDNEGDIFENHVYYTDFNR